MIVRIAGAGGIEKTEGAFGTHWFDFLNHKYNHYFKGSFVNRVK
jgi:hypothetical protein